MKKVLFLLLVTISSYGQTLQNPTFGNTTTNTLKIKTPVTVTSVNHLATVEADGSIAKIAPVNLPFITGTVTNGYYPVFTATKTVSNGFVYTNGVFAPLYLPSGTSNFTGQTVVKGNANGSASYSSQSFIITDNLDRPVAKFDNSGRLDMHDYSGVGGVMCLNNMASGAVDRVSHYAMAARNSAGNLNTVGTWYSIIKNPLATAMSSYLLFGYMDEADTSGGYTQPNKNVTISNEGLKLPSIPISGATGLDLVNTASGSAPVQIRHFANNAIERGIIELSINPVNPFESDFIYRTKGFDGVSVNDRFKINGNTGVINIKNLSGTGTRQVVADASGNLSATTSTASYLKYVAKISQSGTSAPNVTVLENNTGTTITWTYAGTGLFSGTSSGSVFTTNTFSFIGTNANFTTGNQQIGCIYASSNSVSLQTYIAGVPTNSVLNNCILEIRIYP